MTRNDIDPLLMDGSESSISMSKRMPGNKGSARFSASQSSKRDGTSRKKAPADGASTKPKKHIGASDTVSIKSGRKNGDTTSVKSGRKGGAGDDTKSVKSKKTIGDGTSVKSKSTKKKKKDKKGSGKDDYSFDGDTSRTIGGPIVIDEPKPEEPKEPERIRREFKEKEKITLMDQGVDLLRHQLHVWGTNRKENAFYKILYEYDYSGGTEKHDSPTKRLIQQKNAIVDHKTKLKGVSSPDKYSIKYNTGLDHSYIIEPHLGEMDYGMAEVDPLKFFDVLFQQPITQHKVSRDKKIQQKIDIENQELELVGSPRSKKKAPFIVKSQFNTIRPFIKVMEKLRRKIAERLLKSVDFSTLENLMKLLEIPAVEEEIKELVS